MPEIKMNMPELPDGYEYTGEYRDAESGEYYVDLNSKVALSKGRSTFGPIPILRKKPELLYCLQKHDSTFKDCSLTADTATPIEKLSDKFGFRGFPYDLILCEEHGSSQVWLGHWNDGPTKGE